MVTSVPKWVSAAFAGVVAFLGALAAVLTGELGFSDITEGQWVVAILAGLTAAGGGFGLIANHVPVGNVVATQQVRGGDVIAGPAANVATGEVIDSFTQVGEVVS